MPATGGEGGGGRKEGRGMRVWLRDDRRVIAVLFGDESSQGCHGCPPNLGDLIRFGTWFNLVVSRTVLSVSCKCKDMLWVESIIRGCRKFDPKWVRLAPTQNGTIFKGFF